MIRAAVTGAGRMGLSIQRLAELRDDIEIISVWRRGYDLGEAIADADVIIDFTLPEATFEVVAAAVQQHKPLVCGVSGLDEAQMAALRNAAASIPVLYDRNMSPGITILDAVVRDIGRAIPDGFDVRIEETHHVHKKDAPSGTALKLGDSLIEAGAVGSHEDIGYQSDRRGEVPGDHSVIFTSPTEKLTFSHSVTTRDVFADGALRAAVWLAQQPAGWFSMRDVLLGRD